MDRQQEDEAERSVTEALVAGDEDGLARLYARWSPLVYSIALRSLGEVAGAEEVTRRVFVEAWRSRNVVEATRSRSRMWLVGLTRDAIAEVQGQPRGTSAALADRLTVADAIGRLDPVAHRVLRLALVDGLDHEEIADRTHLSVDDVAKHLRRGLSELREQLEGSTDAH